MSQPEPFFSVIMPSFNSSAVIGRAIDSVLNQTRADLELLIVDDASTDGTPDLITARYEGENRVRLVSLSANAGPAHARNVGFAAARGTWLALLDSDDAWRPERLQRLTPLLDSPTDMVFDNLAGYDLALGRETGPLFPNLPALGISPAALLEAHVPGSAFNYGYLKPLIRRAFVAERGLRYDEELRTGEDRLFYLVLLLEGARTSATAEALYLYTTPLGQASGAASAESKSVPDDRRVRDALDRIVRDYGPQLSAETHLAIDRCLAFIREEGPKAQFYHARNKGRIFDMFVALREPAVIRDILAKILQRLKC